MKTAADYPVGFGFKQQDGEFYGPNGSIGLYHLGWDIYCNVGTPFEVLDMLLGLTGDTGNVGGPHAHVARWKPGKVTGGYYVSKYNRTYFAPYHWNTTGGLVIEAGYLGSDAGYGVRWRDAAGYVYEVFHMKAGSIKVNVGDKIMKELDDMSAKYNQLDKPKLTYRADVMAMHNVEAWKDAPQYFKDNEDRYLNWERDKFILQVGSSANERLDKRTAALAEANITITDQANTLLEVTQELADAEAALEECKNAKLPTPPEEMSWSEHFLAAIKGIIKAITPGGNNEQGSSN